jgi:hypothetical protein
MYMDLDGVFGATTSYNSRRWFIGEEDVSQMADILKVTGDWG